MAVSAKTSTKKPTKTTVTKAAATKAAATKAAAKPAVKPAAPVIKTDMTAAIVVPDVKVKRSEFIARVADKAGLRPNQVKPVLEAVMAELGDLLIKGETLNHPALGKISVNRHKELPNADVVVCKLRRNKVVDAPTTSDPLATAAE